MDYNLGLEMDAGMGDDVGMADSVCVYPSPVGPRQHWIVVCKHQPDNLQQSNFQ